MQEGDEWQSMSDDSMAAVAGLLHKVAPVKFASTDLYWIEAVKRLSDAADIHLAVILSRSLNSEKTATGTSGNGTANRGIEE